MMTKQQPISEYVRIRKYVFQLVLKAGAESRKLPSLTELSKQFCVSRPTVVKALRQLLKEGVLISRQGIGTFTNPRFAASPYCGDKTPVIGILLGDGMLAYLDCYFGMVVSSLMNELFRSQILLHIVSLSSNNPDVIRQNIRNEELDALVCIAPPENMLECLKESGTKVLCAFCDDTKYFASIRPDFKKIGYDAAQLCFAENRSKIAFLPYLGNSGKWDCSLDGIRLACRENGTPFQEDWKFSGNDYLEKFDNFLQAGEVPQAIFVNNMYSDGVRAILAKYNIDTHEQCRLIQREPVGDGSIIYDYDFAEMARLIHVALQELMDNKEPENRIEKWNVYKEQMQ